MSHFNELSPRDHENLSVLFEELSEAIQVVGKIMRHGLDSYSPFDKQKTTNRQLLENELGHVKHAQERLINTDILNKSAINRSCINKEDSIQDYLHHQ